MRRGKNTRIVIAWWRGERFPLLPDSFRWHMCTKRDKRHEETREISGSGRKSKQFFLRKEGEID